jgi:hypothetical protein
MDRARGLRWMNLVDPDEGCARGGQEDREGQCLMASRTFS